MQQEQNDRLSDNSPQITNFQEAKATLRRDARERRLGLTDSERQAGDAARTQLALDLIAQLQPERVACYVSIAPEPSTHELIESLDSAGITVLLPNLTQGSMEAGRRAPAWGVFRGADRLRPGWHGIPEPTDRALPQQALGECSLVIVSALLGAVDGTRLGVGGGWYDRALAHAAPNAAVFALLHENELLDSLPRQDFDQQVDGFITPSGIFLAR